MALVVDHLAAANWQRGGKKSAPRPKPISPLARKRADVGEHAGNADGRSPEEVIALLAAHRSGVAIEG